MWKRPSELPRKDRRTRRKSHKLCRRCAKIDLDTILRRKHSTVAGNKVVNLGKAREWLPDSCSLCNLFLNSLPPEPDRESQSYTLRSFSSDRISDRGWQSVQTGMIRLDCERYAEECNWIVSQLDHNGSPCVSIIQPLLDTKQVQGWLTFCYDNHTKGCSLAPRFNDLLTSIPSFKLINCNSRQIVPAVSEPYATLSYVWGTHSWKTCVNALPFDLPPTIEDAIAVTKNLGLKYLWIDRYCINQEDPREVAEQIAHMDLIYSQSHFTIVAAAGSNPYYGLPGISLTRHRQHHVQIGQHHLISTLNDPVVNIKKSPWMQRGWTYQEGLLSRRRIIFTRQQVYFECSGMYCCEELQFPLRILHTSDSQHFRSHFCRGVNTGMFPRLHSSTGLEIVERIEEYSKRSMTNPSDILKGISGVLRTFERHSTQIRNCYGVPVLPRAPKPFDLGRGSRIRAEEIHKSLRWTPTTGLCAGLCWDVVQPSQRRAGFPSWSWTGWNAHVRWILGDHEWRRFQGDEEFRVSVQLQDGRLVDWNDLQSTYDDERGLVLDTLHVQAWASEIQVVRPSRSYPPWKQYIAEVILEDQSRAYWEFWPTTNASLSKTPCVAIQLGQTLDRGYTMLLVVCETENWIWERVGIGCFGDSSSTNGLHRELLESENSSSRPRYQSDFADSSDNMDTHVLKKAKKQFKLR